MAASLVYNPRWQLIDGNGNPYAGAKLRTKVAGTDTDQPVYQDVDLSVPHANPVIADGNGRFPLMFYLPTGYKLLAYDASDVLVWTADDISDPGAEFAENFGTAQLESAALSVTAGYTVTAANRFVTVASSGATTINLPAVSTRKQWLTIKNMAGGTVVVTPNGSDKIESSLSTYTIEAAATPLFPSITLVPGTGTWWIWSSHRAA